MKIAEANHPVWNLLRLIVMMVALTAILYMTASKFDQTEIKTIVLAFIAGGMGVGLESAVRALRDGKGS